MSVRDWSHLRNEFYTEVVPVMDKKGVLPGVQLRK